MTEMTVVLIGNVAGLVGTYILENASVAATTVWSGPREAQQRDFGV